LVEVLDFLRELVDGTAPELFEEEETWCGFEVNTSEFAQLLEYIAEDIDLSLHWGREIRYSFNYKMNQLKLGKLGVKHQVVQSLAGTRILKGARRLAKETDGDDPNLSLLGGKGIKKTPGCLVCWPTHPTVLCAMTGGPKIQFQYPDAAFLSIGNYTAYLILEIADSEAFGDLRFSAHEYLLRSDDIRHLIGLKTDTQTGLVRLSIWGTGDRRLRSGNKEILIADHIIRTADWKDGPDDTVKIPLHWFVSLERAKAAPNTYDPKRVVEIPTSDFREIVEEAEAALARHRDQVAKVTKRKAVDEVPFEDDPNAPSRKYRKRSSEKKAKRAGRSV